MENPRSFKAQKPVAIYRLARLHTVDGETFDVRMAAGSEKFIGRFTRLAELDHEDGIIHFREPAIF